MTRKPLLIAISAAAFLLYSGGTLNAQAPTDTPKADRTETNRDADFDWGWLGLLGLIGLAGLAGRSRDVTLGTRRTTDRV
jgi:hypothetical protein